MLYKLATIVEGDLKAPFSIATAPRCCIAIIQQYVYIIQAEHNQTIMTTSMNERTHFFIKIYLSHFILQRVMFLVWEVSWRWGQTATYWLQGLLIIVALLSHSGWAAQLWVTESPKPSVCRWLSLQHLVPNWLQL